MSRVVFKNKAVNINGKPRFIFCGEITQFRLPSGEWRDRLEKMAAAGLDCVGAYAGWNFHSPEKDVYDFESPDRDFGRMIDEAKRAGLQVFARPGPYICNEWDLGGYPAWLLREAPRDWRTGDPEHVRQCTEWYRRVNEVIAPRQIDNGGNVIIYQVENEHWWGDKVLFDELAAAAIKQGITVPLISNGGGSVARCGCRTLVDGCDIYTNIYEPWRWRGWTEMASRLAGDAPLMVVEYNGASGANWGGPLGGEGMLPSEWMMSLTRMFIGVGANMVNPFIIAGGITPVDFGSDHCCTLYGPDAAITPQGTLSRKFYMLRLLTEAIASVNGALATARPLPDFWASDNGNVDSLLRSGKKGKFVVAVNISTRTEQYQILLPDGRQFPEEGKFSIAPRVSQFHMLDVDCGGGVKLEYATEQVMKFWRDAGKLNFVVYGPEGRSGHAILLINGKRERIDFTCDGNVCVKRIDGVNLYAVSTEVAERTWFVKLPGKRTAALFGNLDLVRRGSGKIRAELSRAKKLRLFTDGFHIEGLAETKRGDGLTEHRDEGEVPMGVAIELGPPSYRAEDFSWTKTMPAEGGEWKRIEACRPGREILTDRGVYQYVTEFDCSGELPECLEFLGICSVETVIYLNGKRVAAFPKAARATYHELADYRVKIPVAGTIREGKNVLAFTMTLIGRHNVGTAIYAGLSHPVIMYRERKEIALPEWEFADFAGRRHAAAELDGPAPETMREIAASKWRKIDFANPPRIAEAFMSDWLDIRCIRRRIDIPEEWKGRPIFLECGKLDDAWLYVNGKPAGRAYHQSSATFDLSAYANERSMEVMIVGRHYWQGKCLPSSVPTLVTADTVLPDTFLRRTGTDGDRAAYPANPGAFESEAQPVDAQAIWARHTVKVEIPKGIAAPIYVEMDEEWNANAVVYWNGRAIGRYSVIGPDRQFYVPSEVVKKTNYLTIYVDGHGAAAKAGGVKVAPYEEQVEMALGVMLQIELP